MSDQTGQNIGASVLLIAEREREREREHRERERERERESGERGRESVIQELRDEIEAVSYTHLTLPTNREV